MPKARLKTQRVKILALILAGGAGGRLEELTARRAKPVMPFAGTYRLIDIPLTNLHHSQISDVWVVEQFSPHGVNDHLRNGRPWDLDRTHGGLLVMPPYQSKDKEDGFAAGNAEALNMQRRFLQDASADLVLVLSADHLYRFDYRDLVDFHLDCAGSLSMLSWQAPESWDCSRYSVLEVKGNRVTDFWYKPDEPKTRLLSTEVFLYSRDALVECLKALEEDLGDDLGDYGDHLLPRMVDSGSVHAMPLEGYWRDVGTVESYWRAHQDLLETPPAFVLDSPDWPYLTDLRFRSPARIAGSARIENSLISPSCLIEGRVVDSVIGPGCVIEEGAVVESSVLLDGCRVKSGGHLRKAIMESGCDLDKPFGDDSEVRIFSPKREKDKGRRSRRRFD